MPYVEAAGQTLGGEANTRSVESALRAGAGPITSEMIQSYMNPYQQAVADEINRAYDRQLAAVQLVLWGRAFGGSRGDSSF